MTLRHLLAVPLLALADHDPGVPDQDWPARFDDPSIGPAYVTFALDADGKVARVAMKAERPIAGFSYAYRDLNLRPVTETSK